VLSNLKVIPRDISVRRTYRLFVLLAALSSAATTFAYAAIRFVNPSGKTGCLPTIPAAVAALRSVTRFWSPKALIASR
jgi:hypothetical protein